MLNPEQYLLGSPEYAIGNILRRATMEYKLYLYLIETFNEQYQKLKSYTVYNNKIIFNDDRGGRLVIEEYYLWLMNNDRERLKSLLDEYGTYLVDNYLGKYDDIFKYPENELNEICCSVPDNETKELVNSMIGKKLSLERAYRARQHSFSGGSNTGIYNSFTGENVRPHDGTYYIDDFPNSYCLSP